MKLISLLLLLCFSVSCFGTTSLQVDRTPTSFNPASYVRPEECEPLAAMFELDNPSFDYSFRSPDALTTVTSFLAARFQYHADTTDAWQTPAETIALGYGDCEDLTFLTVSFLRALNYKHDLFIVYGYVKPLTGHMWATTAYPGYLEVALDHFNTYFFDSNNPTIESILNIYRGAVYQITPLQ